MCGEVGLVLEGGGMRGVFTAGVLDCFLDENIHFPYVIGASAGASNGLSYASRQRGRAKFCNIDALAKYKYMGLRALLKSGSIMDYNFMFKQMPYKIYPYDFAAYANSGRYVIASTNCLTGESVYFEKQPDMESLLKVCKASCSLPYLCKMVEIDGVPMLDGGIADSIPVMRAMKDGFLKNIVVLTRNKGYRKPEKPLFVSRFAYRAYHELQKALAARGVHYNATLDKLEKLEAEGRAIVIRPIEKLEVGRVETDIDKLEKLYKHGYKCAASALAKIKDFINETSFLNSITNHI